MIKDENTYVHYGAKSYARENFETIKDRDYSNKPDGGLWACACQAKNSWQSWCIENNFRRTNLGEYFYFNLSPTANILRIKSLEDCKELILRPVGYMHEEYLDSNYEVIEYRACMESGIDAIEYKYDVASELEEFEEINKIMWGWDCDSVLILNPDIIVPVETKD